MNGRTFLKVAGLSLLWGPAFLYMNVAVKEIPPLTLVAARVSLAALILLAILRVQGIALPRSRKSWKQFAFTGLTYNALPFFLISWSQQHIDSALAAILVGATPLFTMLMSRLLGGNEQLDRAKVIGALVGFGGVFVLFIPGLVGGVQVTILGMAAAVGAAASYGVALVYSHKYLRGQPPLVGPTAQLTMASLFLIPLSLIIDQPFSLALPSMKALGALLLLTVLSTALAFTLYYRFLEQTSATNLSLVTYLNPIVATVLGVLLLSEQVGPTTFLGTGLILFGAAIVNGLRLPRLILKPQPQPCPKPVTPIPC
jgi:drug/metabolite transporter (DMT)-like permease